ncbi:MAG: glutamate--cysteine ligase [Fischerella sp. CENA71]|nr:glutamate--cysteine ligase [Fischerella sp. CENA71]
MFYFGIEHEVAFLNAEGKFADFSCTKFADFNQVIEQLPTYANDSMQLCIGDAGIRKKRWYIEGFERFAEDTEKLIDCIPKGIEIRTTIKSDIKSTIHELSESFDLLRQVTAQFDLSPILISFNPYKTVFQPEPPLNKYERSILQANPDEQTAHIFMVSYGPDLNLSFPGLSYESLIDIAQKLTYYSPYIVPFSFSSPFYNGDLWSGLSVRTFIRTGKRAAAIVFVEKPEQLIKSTPSLTKIARIPAEVGRIEFKSFDSCDDFSIYAALLALLKGLVLDKSLPGRAIIPDAKKHQISAKEGFNNQEIFAIASQVLQAAEVALQEDADVNLLTPLKDMLNHKQTRASVMITEFKKLGSIEQVLKNSYSGLF